MAVQEKIKTLIVSAEAVPFAKVGGLADVAGTLPLALRQTGVDARLVIPGYGSIPHFDYNISYLFSFNFSHKDGISEVQVFTCVRDGVPVYFLQAYPYFGQETAVYLDWAWDVPRFIFFNQMVMAFTWELKNRVDWFPDVIHANDWHTGLLPFLVAHNRGQADWAKVSTVITIHNIAYQGNHVGGFLWQAGIPTRHHVDLVYQNLTDNLLAIGVAYSDIVTTVSPRYAIEIQYPHAGYELTNLIRVRSDDLYGILNGLDVEALDPATDPIIVSNYDSTNFEEKRPLNKAHLQEITNLPIRDDVPLIGIVSRLTTQKGFDLIIPAMRQLLASSDAQFVVLGSGDSDIEYRLQDLSRMFPQQAWAYIGYNAEFSQKVYAGCDIFLMPSKFEPCGIGQMIAMRYGALPLVRETGGLADTVQNYDNEDADAGTGFSFLWEEPGALYGTLTWALETYYTKKDAWIRMQERGMKTDFSWTKSAKEYVDIYQKAIQKHQ